MLRFILIVCLVNLLSACVNTKTFTSTTVSNINDAKIWELRGKLLLSTQEGKWSTNLYWQHSDVNDDFKLLSFVGSTILTLQSDLHTAKLEFNDQKYSAQNAESLILETTGFVLPIKHLPYWITGRKSPTSYVDSYKDNRPKIIITNADNLNGIWIVDIQSWQNINGIFIPEVLTADLVSNINHQNLIHLKIKVTYWSALKEQIENFRGDEL